MRVSNLLDRKGSVVATIQKDATVAEAVSELRQQGIGALVVSPDGARIEGILSERDVVRRLADGHEGFTEDPVSSIMSTSVHTCEPDDEVDVLMTIMTERRIRHVPVVADGKLCGIVSIGDVVKSRIDELERDAQELAEYIRAR